VVAVVGELSTTRRASTVPYCYQAVFPLVYASSLRLRIFRSPLWVLGLRRSVSSCRNSYHCFNFVERKKEKEE